MQLIIYLNLNRALDLPIFRTYNLPIMQAAIHEAQRPLELVFVRHGESVGNIATQAAKLGDSSLFTDEFKSFHSSTWDLTPRGEEQAIAAGEWVRANIHGGVFDGYYVSTYKRARRTAGLLHLPEGEATPIWKPRDYLREHDWGILDVMTDEERRAMYPEIMRQRDIDPFYFPSLSGESMSNLVLRFRNNVLNSLYREHPDQTAIVVTHGNTMWAGRYNLEGMTPEQYLALDKSRDPYERINNCQILQYSRVNPETGDIEGNLNWMRSVCPWDPKRSRNEWVRIVRSRYTNDQLINS